MSVRGPILSEKMEPSVVNGISDNNLVKPRFSLVAIFFFRFELLGFLDSDNPFSTFLNFVVFLFKICGILCPHWVCDDFCFFIRGLLKDCMYEDCLLVSVSLYFIKIVNLIIPYLGRFS